MMITATIELPKDRDGLTINVGDTVYVNSQEYNVNSLILIKSYGAYVACLREENPASYLLHTTFPTNVPTA